MISGIATVRMTFQAGWKRPRGRRNEIASSGTKTLSRMIMCEPVARIPSVRQSSANVTPGALNGTVKCKTCSLPWHPRTGRRSPERRLSASRCRTAFERLFGNRRRRAPPRRSILSNHWPRRNQDRLVSSDPLQQLFPRPAVAVVVERCGDQMLMHRQR